MLTARAREELRTTRGATQWSSFPALLEWIPAVSPGTESPLHLKPVTDTFEHIRGGEAAVRLAFSVPPRHWKTTTILHAIALLLLERPGFRIAYLTFNDERASQVARELARIVRRAGSGYERFTFAEAELANGSVIRFAGLLAGITGEGFDLVVVDDPYRKRADAESPTIRRRTSETFFADVFTRQGNTPTSYIVLHTRWHTDDLIGEITKAEWAGGNPFEWINLPAINDNGEALLPQHWPVERLLVYQSNVYEWASQFQGRPIPRGAALFDAPTYCRMADLPLSSYQAAVGVDLAYTAKTQADYSVRVDLRRAAGRIYICNVITRQVRAPDFAPVLIEARDRYPGAPIVWHAAGTEHGAADFLVRMGVPLRIVAAKTDKFQRAQRLAAAWNEGTILVPSDAPWAPAFVDELCAFTGAGDTHDDQVDATVSAFSALETGDARTVVGGERRASSARSGY